MILTLRRIAKRPTYTIGKLYINGDWFCDTIEDTDRSLYDYMDETTIKAQKLYCETAIPYGLYKIVLTMSPKYKRIMPRLLNVKAFDGILIHSGNTEKDSCGCIIVGKNKERGKVLESRATFNKLMKLFEQEKGAIYIEIK